MFESTKWSFEDDKQKYDNTILAVFDSSGASDDVKDTKGVTLNPNAVGVVRRFEFSSKHQRMSVVVRNINEAIFRVHIKGSPEMIKELCHRESIPANYMDVLERYTEVRIY